MPLYQKWEEARRFMKISTKGRYGLRILLDLAIHGSSDQPRMLRDIAEQQQISLKYLSRLIIDLRRARMVRSIRGVKGGFFLARKPSEITLLEIIEAMEGSLSIVDCVGKPEKCQRHNSCPARDIWCELNDGIRALMLKITLEEIIRKYNAVSPDYCI